MTYRTDEQVAEIQRKLKEKSDRDEEEYITSGRQADDRQQSDQMIAWWKGNHYSGWA